VAWYDRGVDIETLSRTVPLGLAGTVFEGSLARFFGVLGGDSLLWPKTAIEFDGEDMMLA